MIDTLDTQIDQQLSPYAPQRDRLTASARTTQYDG
jgi:hypothetical protein